MGKQKPVEYQFDPFELTGLKKPRGVDKREILKEVGEFVLESVLDKVGGTNSPVSGHGRFKRLTKKYKARKVAQGGAPVPDLELEGDLLDSLRAPIRNGKLVLKVTPSQNDKADGHNNHSGKSEIPTRRFIPKKKDGETFKKDIIKGMRRIIKSFEE